MNTMNTKTIPQLASNPLAVTEVVGDDGLTATEQEFLREREAIIARGGQTFVEVGTALAEIRDHQGGALYKNRFGTFEAYCRERWDFGRAYGYRLMDAAKVVQELKVSPRGDKARDVPLPTSEKQVRELERLESPELRFKAWTTAVETAGEHPVRASDVRKVVKGVMKENGIKPWRPKRAAKEAYLRINASNVALMRGGLATLREKISKLEGGQKLQRFITAIESLMPE